MISYGFTKEINKPFVESIKIFTKELKKEGFGLLTKIDVKDKFKEKLGVDFKKYIIFGACHPTSAHKAILTEENIGLMLPCNVIVYESGDKSIIKPMIDMSMIRNSELKEIAEEIEKKT